MDVALGWLAPRPLRCVIFTHSIPWSRRLVVRGPLSRLALSLRLSHRQEVLAKPEKMALELPRGGPMLAPMDQLIP